MRRNRAFRRYERIKRIRKYEKKLQATFPNFSWKDEFVKEHSRRMARTHTVCSCYLCQRSSDYCGPSYQVRKKLQISINPDDYEELEEAS